MRQNGGEDLRFSTEQAFAGCVSGWSAVDQAAREQIVGMAIELQQRSFVDSLEDHNNFVEAIENGEINVEYTPQWREKLDTLNRMTEAALTAAEREGCEDETQVWFANGMIEAVAVLLGRKPKYVGSDNG